MEEIHLISPTKSETANVTPEASPFALSSNNNNNKTDTHTMDAALLLTSMRDLISKEISGLGTASPFLPTQQDLAAAAAEAKNGHLKKKSTKETASLSTVATAGAAPLPIIPPRPRLNSMTTHTTAAVAASSSLRPRRRTKSMSIVSSSSSSSASARARTVSMDTPNLSSSATNHSNAAGTATAAVSTTEYESLFASRNVPKKDTQDKMHPKQEENEVSCVAISPPPSPKLSPPMTSTASSLLQVPSLTTQSYSGRKRTASFDAVSTSQAVTSPSRKRPKNSRKKSKDATTTCATTSSTSTSSSSNPPYDNLNGANPNRVLKKKFSWKNYPELENFLIANREEYLRHSALNYTMQQKQYNNRLTERLLRLADDCGYCFDEDDFSFVTVRDRIRCYFKSYVQSRKKRGVIIGYAARRAGLLTEEELEKSANVKGRIVVPSSVERNGTTK